MVASASTAWRRLISAWPVIFLFLEFARCCGRLDVVRSDLGRELRRERICGQCCMNVGMGTRFAGSLISHVNASWAIVIQTLSLPVEISNSFRNQIKGGGEVKESIAVFLPICRTLKARPAPRARRDWLLAALVPTRDDPIPIYFLEAPDKTSETPHTQPASLVPGPTTPLTHSVISYHRGRGSVKSLPSYLSRTPTR